MAKVSKVSKASKVNCMVFKMFKGLNNASLGVGIMPASARDTPRLGTLVT